jgi:hypothetical protein
MNLRTITVSLTLLIILSWAGPAAALINADSCSRADVQSAINGASDGDAILVPAGTCTWTSSVVVPSSKGVVLKGAGIGSTIIIDNTGIYDHAIILNSSASAARVRVTGFTFRGGTGYDGLISVSGTMGDFRIDHNQFDHVSTRAIQVETGYGLIDNNEFLMQTQAMRLRNIRLGGLGAYGDQSWNTALSLGTDDAIYVEDNIFLWDSSSDTKAAFDCEGGARLVFRYNDLTDTRTLNHGPEKTSRLRGCFSEEVYGNNFYLNSSAYTAIRLNAGTAVAFDNVVSGRYQYAVQVYIDRARVDARDWGLCDGSSPYDGNYQSNGYPCLDQPGRSTGNLMSGNPPTPAAWPNQSLEPVYAWNNETFAGTPWQIHNLTPTHLTEGVDYINGERLDYEPLAYPHPLTYDIPPPKPPGNPGGSSPVQ